MAEKIRAVYPGCPPAGSSRASPRIPPRAAADAWAVRLPAARSMMQALTLAVAAWVRHHHTRYDELVMSGQERADARSRIREEMDGVLDRWGRM
jgi:hypothetical protein